MSESEPESKILHNEFRIVITLLTLVIQLKKRYSTPRVAWHSKLSQALSVATPGLNDAQRERLDILQAFETLLSRKDETTATAACKSFEPSAEPASGSFTYTIFAMTEKYNFGSDFGDVESLDLHRATAVIENTSDTNSGTNQGVVCISGRSYWSSILEDPWKYLADKRTGPSERLESHAATLVEYINACMTNPHAKSKFFEQFSQYLVASCWPKMHKRVTHWTSTAFCYFLCRFSEQDLTLAYDAGFSKQSLKNPPKRRDAVLAEYFLQVKKMGLLEPIMKEHPNPALRTSQFPHLTAAFEKVVSSEMAVHIYNRKTCHEFHQFLVALLCAYTTSLEALQRQPSKSLGLAFYNLAIVLWKVARSRILQIHLRTLHAAAEMVGVHLGMPKRHLKQVYSDYMLMQGQAGWNKQVEGEERREDDGDREPDDGEEDDPEKDLGDLRQLWNQATTSDLKIDPSLVYRGWLGLLAAHFESLDIVSRFSTRLHKQGIKNVLLRLLAARPDGRMPSMVDWKSTVMALAESAHNGALGDLSANPTLFTREKAEAVVALLQEHIDGRKPGTHILNTLRNGSTFSDQVHCEAAMASLVEYPGLPSGGGGPCPSLPSFNDPNERAIGVSKPCCPACSELLAILSDDDDSNNGFVVHGCHSTVLPMELPSWLPVSVLQAMVARFKGHLRVALIGLSETYSPPKVSPLRSTVSDDVYAGDVNRPSLLPCSTL